jgi:Clp amino terminal domain, pathogenicity island component
MSKPRKTPDENADEKANRAQTNDRMLIARERAVKATIRANEILAKASSDGLLKEFEEMKRRMPGLPRIEESPKREQSPKRSNSMFDDYTEMAMKAIVMAQEESRRLGHNFVGTEQILLGLIYAGGRTADTLTSLGVNLRDARVEVEKIIGRGSGFVAVEIQFTPRAKRVFKLAQREASQLGHNHIDTEHLLLGLIIEGEGAGVRVLENLAVNLDKLQDKLLKMLAD